MESKVRLSIYSLILTIAVNLLFFIGCIATFQDKSKFYTLLVLVMLVIISALLYAPVAIKADREYICIKTIMMRHLIPIRDIEYIELFQPTMGSIRLFASGGYMGYWGVFREAVIGRYNAYYGKASDCFLVKTTNGTTYVLGCQNPQAMVSYIQSNLHSTPTTH